MGMTAAVLSHYNWLQATALHTEHHPLTGIICSHEGSADKWTEYLQGNNIIKKTMEGNRGL